MCTGATIEALGRSASTCKTLFGPNGLYGCVEGEDGRTAFTDSGVEAFGVNSDPVMSFIGQDVRRQRQLSGDGSKRLCLMVATLLAGNEDALSRGTRSCTELSHAFHWLRDSLLGSVIPSLVSRRNKMVYIVGPSDSNDMLQLHLRKIITASFSGLYSYSIRKHLLELIVELVSPDGSQAAMHRALAEYQQRLSAYVVCVEGLSVSMSRVYPGFILDHQLTDPSMFETISKLSMFKVLLLHSDLGLPTDGAVLRVSSRSGVEGSMDGLAAYTTSVVEWMDANNIRVVLASVKLSSTAVSMLSRHNIAAIQLVDKDVLLAMAQRSGTLPFITTTHLNTLELTENLTATCLSIGYINIGRKRLLHLELAGGPLPSALDRSEQETRSLLLCAPTSSYCRQLTRQVSDSIKVVRLWMKHVNVEGSPTLVSVCGGGAWEIGLARELNSYIANNDIQKETLLWTAITSLQKALMQVPCTLVNNASPQLTAKKAIKNLLMCDSSPAPVMISAANGAVREVGESHSWPLAEPLTLQVGILTSALTLVSQVLRIDRILSVRKGILINRQKSEENDSGSDSDESSFVEQSN